MEETSSLYTFVKVYFNKHFFAFTCSNIFLKAGTKVMESKHDNYFLVNSCYLQKELPDLNNVRAPLGKSTADTDEHH